MSKRRILITAALPYANSPIHIGHLVEHFQVDFWTRYQKLKGHEAYFLCADDTHGTPVMLAARNKGISPEEHIAEIWKSHTQDFKDFLIHHDHYSSTNSPANRSLCEEIFSHISKAHIRSEMVKQLYCEYDKMFLPDRFVKGTCPRCQAQDQYGDSCDKCGATYSPVDLISPRCSLCGNTPALKESEHLLFRLDDFRDFLLKWLPGHCSKEVSNKMLEWFDGPLRDWDISRDKPYFGFQIPGYPDKYFYVWVDAPMGYVSSTKELCEVRGLNFDSFWRKDDEVEVYHMIGKDITYFHTLFWPALLKGAHFRTPSKVLVHGFLTVNGEKMSKSKGTQISARHYLRQDLDPQYLRYYLASKMNSGIDDFDFNTEDFHQRVNSDLIGKITNLASRSAQMLTKKLDGILTQPNPKGMELIARAQKVGPTISGHYEAFDFAKAINEIRALADETNRYFDEAAPWKTLSEDPLGAKAVITSVLNVFRILTIYLSPILPKYSQKVSALFGEPPYDWADRDRLIQNQKLLPYEHLASRLAPEKAQALIESDSN